MAADHQPWLLGLDDDLAGVPVEVQVGHARLVGDDREHVLPGLVRPGEHRRVRADGDPLAKLARQVPDEVPVASEAFGITGVHHQLRALVFHLGHGNVGWHFLGDRLL